MNIYETQAVNYFPYKLGKCPIKNISIVGEKGIIGLASNGILNISESAEKYHYDIQIVKFKGIPLPTSILNKKLAISFFHIKESKIFLIQGLVSIYRIVQNKNGRTDIDLTGHGSPYEIDVKLLKKIPNK